MTTLWERLTERLSRWRTDWRMCIDTAAEADPRPRSSLHRMQDNAVFKAFAISLISGNTRWDRIASIRAELGEPFQEFSPKRFSTLSDAFIREVLVPWFRVRRAGSAGLEKQLVNLRRTSAILAGSKAHRHARDYLEEVLSAAEGSPEGAAMLIGASPRWKLPGFGIPLAAEALRLLGFDLCKPDRHILRAMGSWRYVQFARWERKGAFTAPQARPDELLDTMLAVRALAEDNRMAVSYTNSVIWLAGAVSGPHLTNLDFERMVGD